MYTKPLKLLLLVTAGLFLTSPVDASWAEQPVKTNKKWSGWADVDAKTGNKRTIGEVDIFAPIIQNSNSMLFLDTRQKLTDNDEREFNLGLGYRNMIDNDIIFGAYAYFDRKVSELNNMFSMATFGVELIDEDWKFRLNDYQPIGKRSYSGSNPAVSISGSSIQITSSGEVSLHGNDAEIGYRLPIFAKDSDRQLWLYAGAYSFSANNIRTVEGPRARAEFEIANAHIGNQNVRLKFTGEIQNDDVRDTQWFVGVRLGIPFDSFKDAGDTKPGLTTIEKHMTDPVWRDVDIISIATTEFESAKLSLNNEIISSLVTVTAADNLSTEIATAGANSVVVLDGSGGAFSTSSALNLSNGQTLISGGQTISVIGDRSGLQLPYTLPGSAATINGNVASGGTLGSQTGMIILANDNIIKGMTLANNASVDYSHTLYSTNADNSQIIGNTITNISDNSDGIRLNSCANCTISGNTTVSSGLGGNSVKLNFADSVMLDSNVITLSGVLGGTGINLSNSSNATISNNTINISNDSAKGMDIGASDNTNITGNTIHINNIDDYGIFIQSSNGVNISDNSITDDAGTFFNYMIYFNASDDITIENNQLESGGDFDFLIYADIGNNKIINNNNIINTGNSSILILSNGGSEDIISNNTITDSGSGNEDIYLSNETNLTVSGNSITDTDVSIITIDVTNSSISGSGNTHTGTNTLCTHSGSITGTINFVGGAHCP